MSELLEHLYLLKSPRRIATFRHALRAVVRPGDVVLDVGCGTGILGFLALQAGAARVIGVDRHPVVFLAREIARANGWADRCAFLHASLPEGPLPEKADVIVSDIIAHGGIDTRTFQLLAETRRRWGRPGCRMMPGRGRYWLTPVSAPKTHRSVWDWGRGFGGMNLDAIRPFLVNRGFHLFERTRPLGSRTRLGELDLRRADERIFPIEWNATLPVTRAGTLHGLQWDYGLELSSGRSYGTVIPMGRPPFFFPVAGVGVRRGDRVRATVLLSGDRNWSWSSEVRRGGRVLAKHRSAGALASLLPLGGAEMTERWRPRAPRELREAAEVLRRMDGSRTLSDLARNGFGVDDLRRLCLKYHVGGSR